MQYGVSDYHGAAVHPAAGEPVCHSLSGKAAANSGAVTFWPVDFTLENYRKVLTLKGIPQATLISVSITVICTLEQMFISGYLGYLLSRERMPYRKAVYRFFIGTMFVGGRTDSGVPVAEILRVVQYIFHLYHAGRKRVQYDSDKDFY